MKEVVAVGIKEQVLEVNERENVCVRVCAHIVNPMLFSSTHLGLGAEQVRGDEMENCGILLGTLNLKMQALALY